MRDIYGVSAHIWGFSNIGLAVHRVCICAKVYLLFSHLCFLGSSEMSQEDFTRSLSSYEIITSLVNVKEDSSERVYFFP